MAETPVQLSAPYITFGSLTKFINDLGETTIPHRIDRSVFGKMSGGLAYSILSALKFLKLIDAEGVPQDSIRALVAAPPDQRGPLVAAMLKAAYPTFWDGSIDLKTATAGQFNEHLRDKFGITGSTIDKAASFFLAAAADAGIEISPHIKKRSPVAPSTASKKTPSKRGQDAGTPGLPPTPPPAATGQPTPGNEVAVLMSIIDMETMDDAETEAVWTLVKYLKRQEAERRKAATGSAEEAD